MANKSKLIQFKVSNRTYDELQKLASETESSSLSETIRDSLKLYKWIIEMKKNGYKIFTMSEDGSGNNYEVVLPLLNSN